MPRSTPATQALDHLDIPYRLFEHPQVPGSLEQAARDRGQLPQQVVRSLLFRIAPGEFVLVLVAGPQQVSWPKLRGYLGVSHLTMASEQEVLECTGYPIGAVGPLGLAHPVRLLVDRGVFDPEEVSIGSGVRGLAIILKSSDLQKALKKVEILLDE
ncbi:MAG: YbaK/EbsC family protein [Anaerolineales bacterium]|jgi:Cys-tRNA(Pro) deacylase